MLDVVGSRAHSLKGAGFRSLEFKGFRGYRV